jgi:hypothetical protein
MTRVHITALTNGLVMPSIGSLGLGKSGLWIKARLTSGSAEWTSGAKR